jgi:hypothetical protein
MSQRAITGKARATDIFATAFRKRVANKPLDHLLSATDISCDQLAGDRIE